MKIEVMSMIHRIIAQNFYTAMANKDISGIEKHIPEDIHFVGPFDAFQGKERYLQVVKNFMDGLESLNIRSVIAELGHAVVCYDVAFPSPIGKIRGAALLDFEGDQIKKVELFYDASSLQQKAQEIFAK
jgi:hypothetical protein